MESVYLDNAIAQFQYYKSLGEKTLEQLQEDHLFYQPNETCNSIAIIVKHMRGNMLSRWTDFLTTDGEKEWRKRDTEFDADIKSRDELMDQWNEGWNCLLGSLAVLTTADVAKATVYIRGEAHAVSEAINRQLAHYAYHVGQIVFIGKMLSKDWHALSIAKGQSESYNEQMRKSK